MTHKNNNCIIGIGIDPYSNTLKGRYSTMKVKELKNGDFFTKKRIDSPTEKQVFIRGEYDREQRKYECTRFDDICAVCYLDGSKEVFTDFTF